MAMPYLYNDKIVKLRRRSLRGSQTDAERKIWNIIRGKKLSGFKFLRQYSVGSYILDFYCPALRLAIEIDGSQHIDNAHDIMRTAFLRQHNISVLRFWNNDVLSNMDGVCKSIMLYIATKKT